MADAETRERSGSVNAGEAADTATGGDEDNTAADSQGKVVVFFQAVGSAPPLKKKKFKVSSEYPFSQIFEQLRKMLRLQAGDALFCYINEWFQPAPDETLANLNRCFGIKGTVTVRYSLQPAWG